ncbi:MAG: hexitol phosphatase HxpB, partial [Rhodothermia bacterium]
MSELKAVIFDMDGVLVDSEPFWRRAQVRIFGEVGLSLTSDDTDQTMGVRIDEVVQFWFDRRPWRGPDPDTVARDIVDEVIRLVHLEGKRMRGVTATLDLLRSLELRVGLATSSSERLIDAVLSALRLENAFSVRCSAVDEEFGKPHPAVFLTTAARLGVNPRSCLVIEDSVIGVRAGKAAGMTVVA